MKDFNVFEYLCINDKRNPLWVDVHEFDDEDEIQEPRGEDCYCDNCFYGRDKLAMRIIELEKGTK
jgi:hypothetical protein